MKPVVFRSARIRKLVAGLGIFVGLVTVLVIPTGFALVKYFDFAEKVTLEAEWAAAEAAEYASSHNVSLSDNAQRVVQSINSLGLVTIGAAVSVLDAQGRVIDTIGPSDLILPLSRDAPIVVAGSTIGHIAFVRTLWPLAIQVCELAALTGMLGFAVCFAVFFLPFRTLDRTLAELGRRERELSEQNLRFDVALNNMSHGLCMFDGSERLIVCNERYASLYSLTPEQVRPGTTLRQIIDFRVQNGMMSNQSKEEFYRAHESVKTTRGVVNRVQELLDGRTISMSHQQMAGGGWLSVHEDVTERRRSEAQIAHMAKHDALTNLPNRTQLRERLQSMVAGAQRGFGFAVLYLDLDHFKHINDSLGHPVGDALLQSVANRLKDCVRETDLIARLGGDEFAIIQTAVADHVEASVLAGRILEKLGAPHTIDELQLTVGASTGISLAPSDGVDPDELIKKADLALYRAKSEGRGRFCFFLPEMDARAQKRRIVEVGLREALAAGQIEVWYQPLIRVQTESVSGLEALVRWRHPVRGIVPPLEFIQIAEEIGLIIPLGEWVLRQACAKAAKWPDHIKLAVNLSPAQFKNGDLVDTITSALASSGLPARRLELEITESILVQDNHDVLRTLHQLRRLGVHISMDDFGTGYSSLSYLRSFPFDKIKIDRSFIKDLPTCTDSAAIVRAVVSLGRSLGISTTAEGVETAQQFEKVRSEGCVEAQGYLFSRPLQSTDVDSFLAQGKVRCTAA